MLRAAIVSSVGALLAGAVRAGESPTPKEPAKSPDALKAEIEALKAPKVARREIAWRSCLIDGLKESHEKKKSPRAI